MEEREPKKEIIQKGELFHLWHSGTEDTFSGYGLTMKPHRIDRLAGVLMVDRPRPADTAWLKYIQDTYGECQLVPMTATCERGVVCQMEIEEDSLPHLRRFPSEKSTAIQLALEPLLENPPKPVLNLRWDEEAQLWRSKLEYPNELPSEIREVFENTGYGCLAAETNIGVVHVCHTAGNDIEGFADKPARYQWQLIQIPTAPLLRLEINIDDQPGNPYRFESFLNAAADDQARVLAQLVNQNQLFLAFYDERLDYRFTKILPHDEQQWQQLDELWEQADSYWESLPPELGDFDLAKATLNLN